MKIAVEGCMHGDLDNVYRTLQHIEKVQNTKIDLLLCCGDFQGVRNEKDLKSLSAITKLLIICGNRTTEGGRAPNIYFLGFAGVVKFGNLRIGGLSGIYKSRDYRSGHYERPPYNENTIKSVYHVREYDVHKLMQVEEPIHIFLSHDWPLGITDCGDWKQLVRYKPHFETEVRERTLGSKAAAQLLEKLKPPYWFSAHLHCKFAARVQHGQDGPVTNFLALDKCLPGKKFLQVLDVDSEPGPYEIQYDEEWLEITRRFNPVFPLTIRSANFGGVHIDKQDCRQWVRSKLQARGAQPFEFSQTAPSYNPSNSASYASLPGYTRNPQTESLLQFMELPYLLDDTSESSEVFKSPFPSSDRDDSEEIPIDDVDELEELAEVAGDASCASAHLTLNFYSTLCPSAELMVRDTVRSASNTDPTVPGKLLRLLFHDCFVEGCDASVLLQGNGTERSDPANQSLAGFSVIDTAKRLLEILCPRTVSCADIVALAARDAVEITGGPLVHIPTGRRDGKVSSASNVRPNIVDTSFTMNEMIKLFSSKGLSLHDLVTLSGAHTIGAAHCSAFSDRFQQDSKGKFRLIDTSLDIGYAEKLMKQCPAGANPSTTVKNDPGTSFVFDNQYYRNLLAHRGLFQSDSVMFTDSRSSQQVENFAEDQVNFFESWVQSFLKLTSTHVKTGDEGEIRMFCATANT
ncbi:hypothetical protein ACLB2K_018245 [Fragaria x ananassa]